MLSSALFSWLLGEPQLMSLLAENWHIGLLLIAVIIFCETGLVIFPFLPGDSLLFATGAFLGVNQISPLTAILVITLAAVLGDLNNYALGRSRLGQQLLRRGWIKPQHLAKTHRYFQRFGPATITIGRFIPVVRTLAPFLAGLSGMCPRRFALYNVLGAVIWCGGLLLAGFWLGGIDWVQRNFAWLTLAGVGLALALVAWRHRRR